jgi:nicotinate phosphoribosyltransferase
MLEELEMNFLNGDFYAFTTLFASYQLGTQEKEAVFEYMARKSPWGGAMVFAGLERVVDYLEELAQGGFPQEAINALEEMGLKDDGFANYLKNFRFTGDLDAVPEGTLIFGGEPVLKIKAPLGMARLVEGKILNALNYQTLIATKARRVVQAAEGQPVLEFGYRRAQEQDAGDWGARASYLSGFQGTSNVRAAAKFGIPVTGTMMHAWIQEFDNEYEAFYAFAQVFKDNPRVAKVFLVDTYHTLRSGVPNAIRVAKELLQDIPWGIRLDSGDLTYLSRHARKMLDEAGFPNAFIAASNDLNETLIQDLKKQGANIDAWGVGTQNITVFDSPALGGVYKLTEISGHPVLKISDTSEKMTPPGAHTIYRFYSEGDARGDLIALVSEPPPSGTGEFKDPSRPWLKKALVNCEVRELLQPVMQNGCQTKELPSLPAIRSYAEREVKTFSPERLRLINPHKYHVNFSQKLWDLQQQLLFDLSGNS